MVTNKIRRYDVDDVDFVDAIELASDGYVTYRSYTLISTNSGTQIVTVDPASAIDLLNFGDNPAQPNDRIWITGSSAADGYYLINTVLNDDELTVQQAIATSTGGTAYFMHPAGASKIGIDNSNLVFTNRSTVQGALEQLDGYLPAKPVEIGQFLYCVDSDNLVFTAERPLINDGGFIVVNDDDVIVVV